MDGWVRLSKKGGMDVLNILLKDVLSVSEYGLYSIFCFLFSVFIKNFSIL